MLCEFFVYSIFLCIFAAEGSEYGLRLGNSCVPLVASDHGLSIITSNRTNSSQTTEQNHHKRPKKHQKICLALNVTILVDRQRQHEG